MLGIWFVLDLPIELNWSEVMRSLPHFIQTWSKRRLCWKRRTEFT